MLKFADAWQMDETKAEVCLVPPSHQASIDTIVLLFESLSGHGGCRERGDCVFERDGSLRVDEVYRLAGR